MTGRTTGIPVTFRHLYKPSLFAHAQLATPSRRAIVEAALRDISGLTFRRFATMPHALASSRPAAPVRFSRSVPRNRQACRNRTFATDPTLLDHLVTTAVDPHRPENPSAARVMPLSLRIGRQP